MRIGQTVEYTRDIPLNRVRFPWFLFASRSLSHRLVTLLKTERHASMNGRADVAFLTSEHEPFLDAKSGVEAV